MLRTPFKTTNSTPYDDIDLETVKNYLRIDADFEDDDAELEIMIEAAKAFIENHTEKSAEQLNEFKFASILLLKIVSDFYNNRLSVISGMNLKVDPLMEMMLSQIRAYNLGDTL